MKMLRHRFHLPMWSTLVLLGGSLLLGGCASTRDIPMKVQSDPLGAHVLYKVRSTVTGSSNDWIYLGTTPLEVNRSIGTTQLRKADAFVLRVIQHGYVEQTKEWSGERLQDEAKQQGALFWNPRLIRKE